MTEEKELSFWDALVSAAGEMENPKKDMVNPHFKSRYASLQSVNDVVRHALKKYGLAYRQTIVKDEIECWLVTYVYGAIGADVSFDAIKEFELSRVPITITNNPQAMGSALTYAKRYGLLAAFGLSGDDDDDAETATAAHKQQPKQQKQPTVEELSELKRISAQVDKNAVWQAFQNGGIEAARALLPKPELDLADADIDF